MVSHSKRKTTQKHRPAQSLSELLSLYDEPFVHCAYRTILGREADRPGLAHYLGQVRRGVPKIDILASLRRSQEGRNVGFELDWLDEAVRSRVLQKQPWAWWWFRLIGKGERSDANSARLRAIENSLNCLSATTDARLNKIELTVDRVQFLAARQGDALMDFMIRSRSSGVTEESLALLARRDDLVPEETARFIAPARLAPQGISPRAARFLRVLRASRAKTQTAGEA